MLQPPRFGLVGEPVVELLLPPAPVVAPPDPSDEPDPPDPLLLVLVVPLVHALDVAVA
ncbi:MAG TPA: hypothetical protein VFU02_23175 [Polyangiaceae bacterium]|nr:hypothetical protein [Polyangiaceae bacterium]